MWPRPRRPAPHSTRRLLAGGAGICCYHAEGGVRRWMMWDGLFAAATVLAAAVLGSIMTIVLEEVSDLPERIRTALGGSTARSLSARVAELEMRLAALQRKISRPAA